MDALQYHRFLLKDTLRKKIDFRETDQSLGRPAPPMEKPFAVDARRIRLPDREKWEGAVSGTDLVGAISGRRSRRRFRDQPLSLRELAFLLWATQGIREKSTPNPAYRHVPSAGARHSFETYLFVQRLEGVQNGLYRYLPVENELVWEREVADLESQLTAAALGQKFVGRAAVTFVWACIPYRMEWRYSLCAHRVILMDVGHVCQNLYLACQAIAAGTCAVAAYDQERLDALLGVDGEEEFAIYLAPVGKL
jgi:SagB-type dehydrogenase family enzyme